MKCCQDMGRRGKQIRDFVRKDGRMAQQKDKWKEGWTERKKSDRKKRNLH